MTGKSLIIYILQNNLEDEPVFKDGKFLGLITVREAAAKFRVGEETVSTWYSLGMIEGVVIGEKLFIFPDSKNPLDSKKKTM